MIILGISAFIYGFATTNYSPSYSSSSSYYPTYKDFNYYFDKAYYSNNEPDIQVEYYGKAIENWKWSDGKENLAYAYNNRGWLRFDIKEYNLAISDFEKAISLKEEFDAYLGLSLVYMKIKNITKSKEYFEKAVKLEPLLNEDMEGISKLEKKGYWYSENQKQALRKLFNMFLKDNKTQK